MFAVDRDQLQQTTRSQVPEDAELHKLRCKLIQMAEAVA
jgi:hypothetical protein